MLEKCAVIKRIQVVVNKSTYLLCESDQKELLSRGKASLFHVIFPKIPFFIIATILIT